MLSSYLSGDSMSLSEFDKRSRGGLADEACRKIAGEIAPGHYAPNTRLDFWARQAADTDKRSAS
jgi:hypothetical protein